MTLIERDEYVRTLVDFLELLPPRCVVERISGDAPPDYFVGPAWCLDKPAVRNAVDAETLRRDTWQGKHGHRLWSNRRFPRRTITRSVSEGANIGAALANASRLVSA